MYSDLKVHRDGRPGPFLLIVGGQQLNLSADLRLLHSSHAFDPIHTHKNKCHIGFSNKETNFKNLTKINKGQGKRGYTRTEDHLFARKKFNKQAKEKKLLIFNLTQSIL